LKKSKTGWRLAMKTEADVNGYKQELLLACIENRINTPEKIKKGLEQARKDTSDFFPSVGKFITWCIEETEHFEHLAIAKADREFDENQKFLDNKTHNKEFALEQIRKIRENALKNKGAGRIESEPM
jgi:hypothetical protein